ncbi:hypothetical protein AAIG33_07575 [Phytobacter ursingii]|uniref:hypothetical protein n=1 Tax=Phytobacter ursingii TaxID=1972431 RepID=UPI0012B95F36
MFPDADAAAPYPGYHRTFVAPVSGSATGGFQDAATPYPGYHRTFVAPVSGSATGGVPGCGCALSGLPPRVRSPGKRQRHRGCSRMRLRLIRATTAPS